MLFSQRANPHLFPSATLSSLGIHFLKELSTILYTINGWKRKKLNFNNALHYCLIKDDDNVVQAKVNEVSLLIAYLYILF